MIDLQLLRINPKLVRTAIGQKEPDFAIDRLIALEKELHTLKLAVEQLRNKKNQLAKEAQSGITDAIRKESIAVGKELKEKEQLLKDKQEEFEELYLHCPNITFKEVPVGDKSANKVIKQEGTKPEFDFTLKNHVELGNELGWLDFESAAQLAGSQFALYKGEAVKLMYALTMFMFKTNIKHGYTPVLPPYLINEKSLEIASNFPKFKDQVYALPEDKLFLIPTAEASLTNLYRNTIFGSAQLPLRMTSWTSCFRREAGGYGATERGLIRIHQFEKIELYTICEPEESEQEQQKMLEVIEDILQQLGLHYRIVMLSTQETSFQSAKTYDIELWLPGQNEYYEVSSVSNCTDFQARRGLIRYREHPGEKPKLVHTLNGSSLSLARLLVAIMETFQQKDGTIRIPPALKQGISLFD